MTYWVLKVYAVTDIIGTSPTFAELLARKIKASENKKAKKLKEAHLDTAFPRAPHPITGKLSVWIRGSGVYGAIKEALKLYGKPLKEYPSVLGIYFPLECVVIETFHITQATTGEKTLFTAEIVPAGAIGDLIFYGRAPPEKLRPKEIQLGRMKRRGFGLIRLDWSTLKEMQPTV